MADTKNKPAFWVIKCDRFGSILQESGIFTNLTSVENVKQYKREHNATQRLRTLGDGFTAYALYAGDSLDCVGRITRK